MRTYSVEELAQAVLSERAACAAIADAVLAANWQYSINREEDGRYEGRRAAARCIATQIRERK